jgi:hypothetical protein
MLLFFQALNFLVEIFSLLDDLFPFPSILGAGYPVFYLHLADVLFNVILPSVLGSSLEQKYYLFFLIRQPLYVCTKSGDQGCPAIVIHTQTISYCHAARRTMGNTTATILTSVATCSTESSDKKYCNLP